MTDPIDLTATGGGYFRVFVDGVQVSQHTAEREAAERATELAIQNPLSTVTYDHDYSVRVDAPLPVDEPLPPWGVERRVRVDRRERDLNITVG